MLPAPARSLLLVVLAAAGCRSRDQPVSVIVSPELGRPAVLVQLGRSWNVPSAILARPVPASGRFGVPTGHDVVVPFLDLNANGRLDKLVEPAADCGRTAGFACQVRSSRLLVRRIQRQRGTFNEDITVVLAEAFQPGPLRIDEKATLCQPDKGCAGRQEASPYTDVKGALAMKLCEFNDPRATSAAGLPVELRSGERVLLSTNVQQPPAMNLRPSIERKDGHVLVRGEVDLPLHHLVMWVGRHDPKDDSVRDIGWSTEHLPGSFEISGQKFVVRAPLTVLERCGAGCVIGVQAASDLQSGTVAVGTEAVALLGVGEQS
jgi:hypothetical protein